MKEVYLREEFIQTIQTYPLGERSIPERRVYRYISIGERSIPEREVYRHISIR